MNAYIVSYRAEDWPKEEMPLICHFSNVVSAKSVAANLRMEGYIVKVTKGNEVVNV